MPDTLTIGHDVNNGGGRYWIEVEGGSAELTYRNQGDDVIVIDHTFVPPASRDRDIAQRLVERIAEDARTRGIKIIPQCSYADRLFKSRPDLEALRAA